MSRRADRSPSSPFTAPERDLIRREMGMHFGQHPSLADGLFLRTWRGGPQKGEPKVSPAVRSMLARGLVELRPGRMGPPGPCSRRPGWRRYASSCGTAGPWTRRASRTSAGNSAWTTRRRRTLARIRAESSHRTLAPLSAR